MQLVVDIGNTNITIAPFCEDCCGGEYRLSTDIQSDYSAYLAAFTEVLEKNQIVIGAGDSAVLSSVVPLLRPIWQKILQQFFDRVLVVDSTVYDRLPVKIPPAARKEIGTDLVANAVAAYTVCSGPVIVVDFGTALTFTAVASEGSIVGIAIAPGLRTAVNSLFANTAQLPQVQLAVPPSSLGRNTEEAIQSGIVLGYKGLISGLVEQLKTDMQKQFAIDAQTIQVVATGGLSAVLAPLMPIFSKVDRQLTLHGLALIGSCNNV